MTAHILVAPPASGKTQRCIQRVRAVLDSRSLPMIWVVVADTLQVAAFRNRLAREGGGIGVRVTTISDLYRELLALVGVEMPVANESLVYRLVQEAVEEIYRQGDLTHFALIRDKPGLSLALSQRFAELKRARIHPEAFLERTEDAGAHLQEIGRVYAAYQGHLNQLGWADTQGLGWLAAEALEEHPKLARGWDLVIADGFDAFNAVQIQILGGLAGRVAELIVTLPGTPGMERSGHRRFKRSLTKLARSLSAKIENGASTSYLPTQLAELEAQLFEPAVKGAKMVDQGENIWLVEARYPAEEVREALRWLKALHLRSSVPLNKCALVVPDPDQYAPLLRATAREFGIPLRTTFGVRLTASSAIAALLELLELPLQDFPRRLTLEALHSPYFDLNPFGLAEEHVDPLENASRYGQVVGGLAQWLDALDRLAVLPKLPYDADEDISFPNLPFGPRAASLAGGLRALAERLQPPGEGSLAAWVSWLEDFLRDIRYFELGVTQQDREVFIGLREALHALVLSDQIARGRNLTFSGFVSELRGALEGQEAHENTAFSASALQVLKPLEARGVRYQAVALLGLSEGLLPEPEKEDPFFSEAVRSDLGLEPRLGREQAGVFYQMITRSDRYLLLTRPYLSESGEPWEPSHFWNAVTAWVAEEPRRFRPEAIRPLEEAGSSQELLFWAIRRKEELPLRYRALIPKWENLRHAQNVLVSRTTQGKSSAYEGHLEDWSELLSGKFAPPYVWSPSRLESYGTCPHHFFVQSVLEMSDRQPPELGFDAAQLGTMLHSILERAFRDAPDSSDPEGVLAELHSAAAQEFQRAPQALGFRPGLLWQVEQEQLLEMLTQSVMELIERSQGWTPIAYEQTFGFRGEPPLEIGVEGERIELRGVIDRVDQNEAGELRLIDYKTGGSHLSPRDLEEGRRLQLPLYALAAREALQMGDPVEGLYWIIRGGKPGGLRLENFESGVYRGPQGAMDLAVDHLLRAVRGVRSGAFQPQPPRGGCPSYCPAAAWCWQYTPSRW